MAHWRRRCWGPSEFNESPAAAPVREPQEPAPARAAAAAAAAAARRWLRLGTPHRTSAARCLSAGA